MNSAPISSLGSAIAAHQETKKLVVLGCSATKLPTKASLPAITLYDGPTFRVLRSYLHRQKWPSELSIAILSAEHGLIGASAFPRHFVYDREGELAQKAGTVDFKNWYREAHGEHTPWGDEDSEPFVAQAESALERELSASIMKGSAKMPRRKLKPDERLVEQGDPGDELYLVLDGVLATVVDGEEIAQVGPGAMLGEGAIVGEGTRGATLRACTAARVAVIEPDMIDREAMETLAAERRREG